MSSLDTRKRDSDVPKIENIVQYAFNQYNKMKDVMESIKSTPKIDRTVQQARNEYKIAKEANKAKNEQTPVITAEDIKNEMYR